MGSLRTVFLGLLIACGAKAPADKPGEEGGTQANSRIRLSAGVTRITVAPRRQVTLNFSAALTSGGTPVSGLQVAFALQGAGAGSTLSVQRATTNDDGQVTVNFIAGANNGTTRVVASAPDASNAQTEVIIDGANADASVIGDYEFSMKMSPLEFMNKNTKGYVVAYNVVHVMADPVKGILREWLRFDEATQTSVVDTDVAFCYMKSNFGCTAAEVAIPIAIQYALSQFDSTLAQKLYNGILSAGNLLKTVDVSGALTIKTYDPTSKNVTAALNFDSYRLLWTAQDACVNGGSRANDACCGHTLFNSKSMGFQPFIKACKDQGAANSTATCNDLTGKLEMTSPGRYTLNLDQGVLAIAYGTLIMGALQVGILPALLPDDGSYPREPNGNVTLQTFFGNLFNGCGSACSSAAAALSAMLQGLLDNMGQSDGFANVTIAGATLVDTNNDAQVDSLTGTLALAGQDGSTSMTSSAIAGTWADKLCDSDAECGMGSVCQFARSTLDQCFSRNQCGVARGSKDGFADCSNDAECKSGTCIQNPPSNFTGSNINHCFQPCGKDADCGGNGTCDLDGYVSVLAGGATITGTCVR